MTPCESHLLSAFFDGELPLADQSRVETHLRDCATCAAELRAIRESSQLLRAHRFIDLSQEELSDLHRAIDDASDERPILRLGLTLGTLAASILIVSGAWLME